MDREPQAPTEAYDISSELRDQLNSTYATERQDDQSSATIAFAIVAAALTYAVAVGAFLVGKQTNDGFKDVPTAVQLLIPVVPLALAAYLALNLAGALVRSVHIKSLERILAVDYHLTSDVGKNKKKVFTTPSFRSDMTDVVELRWTRPIASIYALCSLFTYIPIVLMLAGFTLITLLPGPWTGYKITAGVAYGVGILIVGICLLLPAIVTEKLRTKTPSSRKRSRRSGDLRRD